MNIAILRDIAKLFSSYEVLYSIFRIDDNLFKLTLDKDIFYIDLAKSKSAIFTTQDDLQSKVYNAPFDFLLQKICYRSKILECKLDGENRILIFKLLRSLEYKSEIFYIHFEFTGRHTNLIILDEQNIVLEALRHIAQSSRVVKVGRNLEPLAQRDKRDFEAKEIDIRSYLKQNYLERKSSQLSQKKDFLVRFFEKKLAQSRVKLESMPSKDSLLQYSSEFAKFGSIILSNLDKIPNFAKEVTLEDFDGNLVSFELPPNVNSPQQGANIFFTKSKKYKKKAQNIGIEISNLEDRIEFLKKQINFIERSDSLSELSILSPQKNTPKSKNISNKNYESFFIDGFKVCIGKNQRENQSLLEDARSDDIWLHIRSIPSSHMIIHSGKQKVRDEVLTKSAQILVGLSVGSGDYLVDYTKRKFVKIIQGASVVYSKHSTLSIRVL